jgi:hypothetical protein
VGKFLITFEAPVAVIFLTNPAFTFTLANHDVPHIPTLEGLPIDFSTSIYEWIHDVNKDDILRIPLVDKFGGIQNIVCCRSNNLLISI